MTIRAIWILRLVAVIVVLAMTAALLTMCSSTRGAKTEARLARSQAGAAVQSGADAVATVGQRAAEDAASGRVVEETKDEINEATDAAGVTDAGRNGLCRLDGYKRRPECVR